MFTVLAGVSASFRLPYITQCRLRSATTPSDERCTKLQNIRIKGKEQKKSKEDGLHSRELLQLDNLSTALKECRANPVSRPHHYHPSASSDSSGTSTSPPQPFRSARSDASITRLGSLNLSKKQCHRQCPMAGIQQVTSATWAGVQKSEQDSQTMVLDMASDTSTCSPMSHSTKHAQAIDMISHA